MHIQPSDIRITDFTATATPDGMAAIMEGFTEDTTEEDSIQILTIKTAITIMPAGITVVPVLVLDKLFRPEAAATTLMVTTGKIRNVVR